MNGNWQLDPEVTALLDRSRRRIVRLWFFRGLALTLAAALAGLGVVMVIDGSMGIFSAAVRYALSAAYYLVVAVVAGWFWIRPVCRRLDDRRIAAAIDALHPETRERLSALVELSEQARRGEMQGISEALYGVLNREAAAFAIRFDPRRDFPARKLRQRLVVLAALAVALLFSVVVLPHLAGRLVVRSLAPWVEVGNLYADDIELTPGDVVTLEGRRVTITAKVKPQLKAEPWIRIQRRTAGGWSEETAERMGDDGVYETTASLDEREWRYRISAGVAVTRYYTVRVCEMPRYERFAVRLVPPAYTGLGESTVEGEAALAIRAVAGTQAAFEVRTAPGVRSELGIDGVADSEYTFVSNRTAVWTLKLENEFGIGAPPESGQLVSFEDAPPVVAIEKPASSALKLAPHAEMPLEVTVSDDIGVERVEVICAVDDGGWQPLGPLAGASSPGGLWRGEELIDLSRMKLELARRVRFAVVAGDACPLASGQTQATTSTPVTVTLDINARSFELQGLDEQFKEAQSLLDGVIRRLDESRNTAARARDRVYREKRVGADFEAEVERSVHAAAEARARADEFMTKLARTPRLRPLAAAMARSPHERLERALAALERSQFATGEERFAQLDRAANEIERARREMDALKRPLAERRQAIENYEQVRDLADRQRSLAEAAAAILAERPIDLAKVEAWKRMEKAALDSARGISSKIGERPLAEARQAMEAALQRMDELQREATIAGDARLDDDKRAAELARARADVERSRNNAVSEMEKLVEAAQVAAQRSAGERDARRRDDAVRQAQRAWQEAERRAEMANEQLPAEAERALAAALQPALDAQAAEAEKARAAEAARPRNDRDREEFRRQTLAAQEAAATAQLEAQMALARGEDEADLRKRLKEAIERTEAAAAALAKTKPDQVLMAAQEAAIKALREGEKALSEPMNSGEQSADAGKQAADAGEQSADDAAAKTSDEAAAKTAEALRRAQELQDAARSALSAQEASDLAERMADELQKTGSRQAEELKRARDNDRPFLAARLAATQADAQAAQAAAEEAQMAAAAAEAAAQAMASGQAADASERAAEAAAQELAEARTAALKAAQAARHQEAAREAEAAQAARSRREDRHSAAGQRAEIAAAGNAAKAAAEAAQALEEALIEGERKRSAAAEEALVKAAEAVAERLAETSASPEIMAAQEKLLSAARELDSEALPADGLEPLARAVQDWKEAQQGLSEVLSSPTSAASQQGQQAQSAQAAQQSQGQSAQQGQASPQGQTSSPAQSAQQGQASPQGQTSPQGQSSSPAQSAQQGQSSPAAQALRSAEAAQQAIERAMAPAAAEMASRMAAEMAALQAANASQMESVLSSRAQARAAREAMREAALKAAASDRAAARERAASESMPSSRADSAAAPSDSGSASEMAANENGVAGSTRAAMAQATEQAANKADEAANRMARELGMPGSGGGQRGQGGGGGVKGELDELAKTLSSAEHDAEAAERFKEEGWFRVRGSAKDALTDRELKGIPLEYRDLVRDYFLKLAE